MTIYGGILLIMNRPVPRKLKYLRTLMNLNYRRLRNG